MTECTPRLFEFPPCKRRKVVAEFSGGDITSDGGSLLLREADRRLGLCEQVAAVLPDQRDPELCTHTMVDLVRQRVYGLAQGYEDLNDHTVLRHDPAFQTALNRDVSLASSSTLCRFENSADREIFWKVQNVFVDQFIASFFSAPDEVILDFDATDNPIHGDQVGKQFHGYYDQYCFLPLYVYCGEQILVSYLRHSRIDAAKHAGAILKWLVKRLREAWPDVRIVYRGDSGFCRPRHLSWCERNNVCYIIGIGQNSRLLDIASPIIDAAEWQYSRTLVKQRIFGEIQYAAGTWKTERRVIVKAERLSKGSNPRFVVTNLKGDPAELYDVIYCHRGEMENRIKEQQLCLFSVRTSAHEWWTNQLRLFLSALGYMLLEAIRRLALEGTKYARARCDTIRLKLLKIGAVIRRNTRRVHFHLSSVFPDQELFFLVANRLCPE